MHVKMLVQQHSITESNDWNIITYFGREVVNMACITVWDEIELGIFSFAWYDLNSVDVETRTALVSAGQNQN